MYLCSTLRACVRQDVPVGRLQPGDDPAIEAGQWTLILDYLLLHHSKVIVHRLEEELVVRPIENILEVAQRNLQNR